MGRKVIERIVFPSTLEMFQDVVKEAIAEGDLVHAARAQGWVNEELAKLAAKKGGLQGQAVHEVTVSDGQTSQTRRPVKGITEGQAGLIDRLIKQALRDKPEVGAQARAWFDANRDGMSFDKATSAITSLKTHLGIAINPKFVKDGATLRFGNPELMIGAVAPADTPVVEQMPIPAPPASKYEKITLPDGYYAIGTDDDAEFFRVKTGKTGFVSFKRVVGGSATDLPTLYPMRWTNAVAASKKIIAMGVHESNMMYARLYTRCYRCAKQLTDADSRERGMGSTCASK